MLSDSIDVHIRASGYENIYFDCPTCGKENIINRVTDLKNDLPISRLEGVICRNNKCKQPISLIGDSVNSAKYEWFLHELYIFVARKEYRSYILSLCQGIEAFFYQAVINKKFDRNPDLRDTEGRVRLDRYNTERQQYDASIKTYAFAKMRKEFLSAFEAEFKDYLPTRLKMKEDKREFAFNTIKGTNIDSLRNKVAHKNAYRPTWDDVEIYDSLVDAVYWLGMYLDVEDSVMIVNRRLQSDA